jgi:hypothetical protein
MVRGNIMAEEFSAATVLMRKQGAGGGEKERQTDRGIDGGERDRELQRERGREITEKEGRKERESRIGRRQRER